MMVSVVMPAYNAANHIEESVRSVLAQSIDDWELLIIDDCSGDSTKEIAEGFAKEDPRIRVLHNEVNHGVAYSRNRGVNEAKGEWIAFLDSDDLWRGDKLEKQLELIEKTEDAALTYTASSFIDEAGKPFTYILHALPKFTYRELLHKNLLSCSSVMVKRELMQKYPMPGDGMHEDYASWLRMLREIPCAYGVDDPLLIYRLSRHSKSGSRVKSGEMIYRSYRFVGYGVIASLWLTVCYMPYSIGKRKKIYQVT